MRAERGNQSVRKEVYERGKQIATEFDIEPSMLRTTRRQQHRVNGPVTKLDQSYRSTDLIQEMNDRLLSQEDRFLGQYLPPTKLQRLSNDFQDKMYAAYKNDLTDKGEYDNEMSRWKRKWLHSTGERPATLADPLDCINPTLYRNVNTFLTILLMMPLSTATPERSFSTIRRVKTYIPQRQSDSQLLL